MPPMTVTPSRFLWSGTNKAVFCHILPPGLSENSPGVVDYDILFEIHYLYEDMDMRMKRTIAVIALALVSFTAFCQTPQAYIDKWAPTAVREMYRSGVPASITLAQGLLESRYGLSALATEGNNHFGIKCHNNWNGGRMYYDDDAKGECFRKYKSAEESFVDHSDFLRYRDRYKFLFEYKTTDYKAWAHGLKKAGYATDPGYPSKLIKYIEDYKLYEYDKMSVAQADKLAVADSGSDKVSSGSAGTSGSSVSVSTGSSSKGKTSRQKAARARKSRKEEKKSSPREIASVIPASPLSIEEPKKIEKGKYEEFRVSLSREAYSRNGVPFVSSIEGETYSSIAKSYGLFLREILKYNDLSYEKELRPGTVVYLQSKKNQSEKGLDKYIVDCGDETLWAICQRFGVKMKAVEKMNGFDSSYCPREGDEIILRGKRR